MMDRRAFINNGADKDCVTEAVWQLLKNYFPDLPDELEVEVRITVNGYRLAQQSINQAPKKEGRIYAKSMGDEAREIMAELLDAHELRERLTVEFIENELAPSDRQNFDQLKRILTWFVEHADDTQQCSKSAARRLTKKLSPVLAGHKLMLPDICWAYATEVQCKICDPLSGHLNRLISATDYWVGTGGKSKRHQFAKPQFVSQLLSLVDPNNEHPLSHLIECFERISEQLAPFPSAQMVADEGRYDLGGDNNIKRYIRLHRE
jgi:hypothetical protein